MFENRTAGGHLTTTHHASYRSQNLKYGIENKEVHQKEILNHV
jgi:hypothetical protein